jgi:RNA polymerase sigma-70 factor (ECF subfamily)
LADTATKATPAGTFDELRPLLFSIAYRMLASVASAEDVVQEAFVRFDRATRDGTSIESPKAYLSAVVTRLAIDELKSARVQRETYVGTWLPEPLVTSAPLPGEPPLVGGAATDPALTDPAAHAEAAETLSMAFLLVLDRLNPVERAVFLLHDVFGYEFAEIAGIIDRSEANCRQIAVRARRRVRAEKPRLDASRAAGEAVARQFFEAMGAGDVDGLTRVLAADVVVHGDGGGKAPQWMQAIAGIDRVSALMVGVGRQMADARLTAEPRQVNGQPGAIVRTEDGQIVNVFVLDVYDGQVTTVRSVINPDKLRHLGRVADVRALARDAAGIRSTAFRED